MSKLATDLNLDTDTFEIARAVHRIVRAMHDGECPACHNIHPSECMQRDDAGEQCPSCGFAISGAEICAAMETFAPVMERNLAVFEQWRKGLKSE